MTITDEPKERNKVVDKRAENRREEVGGRMYNWRESEIGDPTEEKSRTKSARREEIRPKNTTQEHV
jgi:hypothetical protein